MNNLPDDLKNYSERPGFLIFTEDEVAAMLGLLIVGLVAIDTLRQLAQWMFA